MTAEFQIASFRADITCPLGHRCMGILPTKARRIVDPLDAHGFVLLGGNKPLVVVALDWCEVRNDAYDRWRQVLADAAGTTRERVLLSSVHQHDAPVADLGAENLLAKVGLAGEFLDLRYHEQSVQRVAAALRGSLKRPKRITHFGIGQAKVEQVASNRRVVLANDRVTFSRGSSSGRNPAYRDAPDGQIDPQLKTLSFWDGNRPRLAFHAYSTHPMSYYGKGGVSADFPGMARRKRQRDDASVHQMYATGCAGDTTAGRYNDGSPANRPVLADRLHAAMKQAWQATTRHRLDLVEFRSTKLDLPFRDEPAYTTIALTKKLENPRASIRERILAAMGLASRWRVSAGRKIDFPCVDFGPARLVLFPAEAFVGYQLLAQKMKPKSFVMSVGYSECWPGYIPTRAAFADKFTDKWLWVAPGSEARIRNALKRVL